jgi:hypothetical protein
MNSLNPSAMLQSLIVYAICVPLAIVSGYMLTDPLDYGSVFFEAALVGILVFPLVMKWHYPILVFSFNAPINLFFLPGRPSLFIVMVATSLTISIIERILNKNRPFLTPRAVSWPLIALLGVVVMTAELTGGFGLCSMGSDVYGGRKYVTLIVGILSFFALTARPIAKKDAKLYITLYFAGTFLSVISDLYPLIPPPINAIYYVIPPAGITMTSATNTGGLELGVTRLSGIAAAAGAVFFWMLARNGFRQCFLTNKLWRPVLMGLMFVLVFLGGFRSSIIGLLMIAGLVFYLEKLHRTGAIFLVIFGTLLAGALVVPLASKLPYTFQRGLAFLPVDISPDARRDAEGSTEWRLEMWSALLPEVPNYLLLGKGYAFSAETYDEYMGADAVFKTSIDASQNPLALSSDFHSGPLSVIFSFGIWGVIAWLAYWAGGFFVVWRNYRFGDPALRQLNLFLFAMFISKCLGFLFIFGAIVDDVGGFAAIIGLSVAINQGVMRRPQKAMANPAGRPSPAYPRLPGHPAAVRLAPR